MIRLVIFAWCNIFVLLISFAQDGFKRKLKYVRMTLLKLGKSKMEESRMKKSEQD